MDSPSKLKQSQGQDPTVDSEHGTKHDFMSLLHKVWAAAVSRFSALLLVAYCSKTHPGILPESGPQHPHFNESDIQAAVVKKCLSVNALEGTRHRAFSPRPSLKLLWRSSGRKGTVSVSTVWTSQHESQPLSQWSAPSMQTAARKRSSSWDLFSAASPVVYSKNKT